MRWSMPIAITPSAALARSGIPKAWPKWAITGSRETRPCRRIPGKSSTSASIPPKSLAEALSPHQASGDSWQNYASRWALCHFLAHAPNYSPQFLSLGRGLLTGQDVSFEQTYGAMARELSFEYLFFLEHLAPGYCVDL